MRRGTKTGRSSSVKSSPCPVSPVFVAVLEHENLSGCLLSGGFDLSPHLLLLLRPPAALCCQVEPEGPALIMAKRLSVTLMQGIAMDSPGQGRTGYALFRVAVSRDNESYCTPSAAAAAAPPPPTVQDMGTNNSVCLCPSCFRQPSHFALCSAGLPWTSL